MSDEENRDNVDKSDNESEVSVNVNGDNTLSPYQYEPRLPDNNSSDEETSDSGDSSDSSSDDSLNENRLGNLESWCRCGNCMIMPSEEECVCCVELIASRARLGILGKATNVLIYRNLRINTIIMQKLCIYILMLLLCATNSVHYVQELTACVSTQTYRLL